MTETSLASAGVAVLPESSVSATASGPPPTFGALGLSEALLSALRQAGYDAPTPIQARAIPPALAGRDLVGCARTGTGKTAAFALPILQRLSGSSRPRQADARIRALVLAPTRELASQITEGLTRYGRGSRLESLAIFGGVSQPRQVRALRRGVDILVATPGRLVDLLDQGLVQLSSVEVLVLDEFDRMLDDGFLPSIRRVLRCVPPERQTLLFSATMPRELEALVRRVVRDPVRVSIDAGSSPERIEQRVCFVEQQAKRLALAGILRDPEIRCALAFTRTKHGANRVAKQLLAAGIEADAIHGNKSQNARERTLRRFRDGEVRVLVATDIAARGIDVDGITHVINVDLPADAETYVHRVGRTARAGRAGAAITLCTAEEHAMLARIERLTGQRLRKLSSPVLAAGASAARPVTGPVTGPATSGAPPVAAQRAADDANRPSRRRRRRRRSATSPSRVIEQLS